MLPTHDGNEKHIAAPWGVCPVRNTVNCSISQLCSKFMAANADMLTQLSIGWKIGGWACRWYANPWWQWKAHGCTSSSGWPSCLNNSVQQHISALVQVYSWKYRHVDKPGHWIRCRGLGRQMSCCQPMKAMKSTWLHFRRSVLSGPQHTSAYLSSVQNWSLYLKRQICGLNWALDER